MRTPSAVPLRSVRGRRAPLRVKTMRPRGDTTESLRASTAERISLLADDELTALVVELLVADFHRRHPSARPAEDEPERPVGRALCMRMDPP